MSVSDFRTESIVELVTWVVLVAVVILAGVLLFTPYESFIEVFIAILIVGGAIAGFVMHPRKDVFYVRTAVRMIDLDRKAVEERDFLAVKVELARLWLLFLPTLLAVACLVFFAAGGPTKFSYFNWLFSSDDKILFGLLSVQFASVFVFVLLAAWIRERRAMRDAEACSARSYKVSSGRFEAVSYLFMGERGEYFAGNSVNLGLIRARELATIVFHNARRPAINEIAMGFLFHRVVVLGRGIKDLDEETVVVQKALAETPSLS